MSWIVERFSNAEMHCSVKRTLVTSCRLCCFGGGVREVADVASVTRKKGGGLVGFRLTGTMDNSRIPGQASEIPVRIRASSSR